MEQRYDAMAAVGVRGVVEYRKICQSQSDAKQMPYIVVIIDELADLMMVAGKDVEIQIVRIAQMARAAGIHLIIATQRPSVDVVTGLIKANFPSRVAFRVSSKIDSRTILDAQGAEKLLGRGDMLFMHASSPELKRVHGAYVSDVEVERVVNFLRQQRDVEYLDLNQALVLTNQTQSRDMQDELYEQVRELLKTTDEISISMIQRHYRIGFNRSARLIERLELDGLLAPAQGSKPRKVLR
jgi:S-DNA-T family DNA segregation ATPase FtsK/SpoIIIE